jgi:two-component system sensor histidine kinase TrcS
MTRDRDALSGDLPRWLPRSLRRQLLLGVLAVVSVVLMTVGFVSVLSLRGYVTAMSDADVAESLDALGHSYMKYRTGERNPDDGAKPLDQAMLQFTDQTPGNLIVILRDGAVIGSAVFSEAEARPAPSDVVRTIEAQSWTDGRPRTENLGSLGFYRI